MKRIWLKIITAGILLAAVLFAACTGLAADEGECGDDVRWNLDDEGVLIISGTGEMTSHPWNPYAVKRAVIEEGVTSIAPSAFQYCYYMTEISIADSVNAMGSSAFYQCSQLTSVRVPEGVTVLEESVFQGCKNLTEVILPESLRAIHKNIFRGCSALKEIAIPDGVNDIASWCLDGSGIRFCYASAESDAAFALARAHYAFSVPGSGYSIRYQLTDDGEITGKELTTLSENLDLDTFTIPEGVTVLSGSLFIQRTDLTQLEIPEGVVRIGGNCFDGCTGLTEIALPETLTEIDDYAFNECSSLTEIHIPDSVTRIGKYAFAYCTGLTSFRFPAGCSAIEDHTLYGCKALTDVVIPEGITTVGPSAFGNCLGLTEIRLPTSVTSLGDSAFYNCSGLTSFDVSDKVTSLGKSVFSGCASLTRVTLPARTTIIGDSLFSSCSSLTEFTMPEGVTSIGASAFSGCSGLAALSIPASVESIGDYAFSGCKGLSSMYFPDSVTTLGASVLSGCSGLTDVRLPAEITAIPQGFFRRCTGLAEMEVPAAVIRISYEAFRDCTGLTRVNLPNGLTLIDRYAFYGCTALSELELPDTLTALGGYAFSKCSSLSKLWIPDGLSDIDVGCFIDCPAVRYAHIGSTGAKRLSWTGYNFQVPGSNVFLLYTFTSGQTEPTGLKVDKADTSAESIVIPEGVTEIPEWVFYAPYKNTLTSITVPNTVTGITVQSFAGYKGKIFADSTSETARLLGQAGYSFRAPGTTYDLKYFEMENGSTGLELTAADQGIEIAEIPNGVTRICSAVFANSESLKQVILPDSVTEIGSRAFGYCEALEKINLPVSIKAIGDYAFSGCIGLTEFTIPDRVTSLGNGIFSGCTGLAHITIPDSVTSIGAYAFNNCSALTELLLPTMLEEITTGMLEGCTGLTQLSIPDSVTGIGGDALKQCSGLMGEIYIPAAISYVGRDAFSGCPVTFSALVGSDGAQALGRAGYSFHLPGEKYEMQYQDGGLTLISVDTSVTGTLRLPEGITAIGERAFRNCWRITNLVLPESLTTVCAYAFSGLMLDKIQLPDGITDLKTYFNYGCDATYCVHMNSVTAQNFTFTLQEFIDPDYPAVYIKRSGEKYVLQRIVEGCTELDLRFLVSPSDVPSGFLNGETPSVVRLPDDWTEVPSALTGLKSSATFVTTYGSNLYQVLSGGNYKYLLKPYSPESISASPMTIFFGKREKIQLSLDPSELDWTKFEEPEFTFTSSDPTIVTVSETGELRGLSAGTATVWVQDKNDPFVNATVPVTVTSSNTEGKLFAFANLSQGTSSVTASCGGQGGVQPYIIHYYTTLDGVITYSDAKMNQSAGGNRVTQTVTQDISSSVYTFKLSVKVTDAEGNSASAEATCTREYKLLRKIGIGTPTVAQVRDEYGNVGYQYIYPDYKYEYGYVDTCVNDDPAAALLTSLTLQDLSLVVGNSSTIQYISSPSKVSASDLVWISSDSAVADVDEYGLVTAFQAGKTVITAYTTDGSGIRSQCTVTAAEHLVESITLTADEVSRETKTQQVTAVVLPDNTTYPEVKWSSSNNSVARIDENGTVTWLTSGSVTVTAAATDGSGVKGTLRLSWDGILMESLTLLRDPEDSWRILWRAEPEDVTNPNVTFASSNPQILSIDAAGKMTTYESEGTVTVRAKAKDKSGLTAELEIYVHFDHTPAEDDAGLAPTCTEAGYHSSTHCSACGILLTKKEEIAPLGHDWHETVYTWSDDLSHVTAVRVCQRDESHTETETVALAETEAIAPSCLEDGKIIYRSSSFKNDAFDARTLILKGEPALGHKWSETIYTWSKDNSSVTATRVCAYNANHVETETVSVASEITKAATCEENGETGYTSAMFENPAFTVQAKTVDDIPALGHSWSEIDYTWNKDNSSVTATRVCSHDTEHVETEKVKTHKFIETHPTKEEEGRWHFVSETFENEVFEIQERSGSLPSLNEMAAATLSLPEALTEIEDEAFFGFGGQAILIPNGVTRIGSRAFANCPNLVYARIPGGAEVAPDAFEGSPNAAWEQE